MNSGVYFITGKLGGGKSLISVSQIQERLAKGCKVATNLDIKLHHMFNKKAKSMRLVRLPDKPTAQDMYALGSGNTSYDESKNGLIVLDECGTWFNARDWNDKGRKALLEWLLYARKLGWDIIFLVQDISMIDKQARKSVSEHVGYCRRVDKMSIPFFDWACKLITGRPIPKPKMHVCVVRLGDLPHSPKVDTLSYMGTHLYSSYDTKQIFRDDYPHGLYSVLPPYYTHAKNQSPLTLGFIMRVTKIYLKRFSRVMILGSGLLAGVAVASIFGDDPQPLSVPVEKQAPVNPSSVKSETFAPAKVSQIDVEPEQEPEIVTLSDKFAGFYLDGVAANATGDVIYASISNGQQRFNVDGLRAQGYVVKMVSKCELLVMNQRRTETARLYTSYCAPATQVPEPPRMTQQERYQWRLQQVKAEEAAANRY